MENLRHSAANGGEDTYDVLYLTTENPATERSETMSEESRGNPSPEPAEIENPNKNYDDEELHSDQLQGVPNWLHEFKHGLVDESVREHRDASSSSHELPLAPRAKSGIG